MNENNRISQNSIQSKPILKKQKEPEKKPKKHKQKPKKKQRNHIYNAEKRKNNKTTKKPIIHKQKLNNKKEPSIVEKNIKQRKNQYSVEATLFNIETKSTVSILNNIASTE